jgi:small conductance mechanosensitive channel
MSFETSEWWTLLGATLLSRLPWLVFLVVVWMAFPILERLVIAFIRTRLAKLTARRDVEAIAGTVLRYGKYFVITLLVLQVVGLSGVVSTALASVGFVGLALGLAAQTVASNMVAGIFLILADEVNVGDRIEVGTVKGVIRDIKLRSTLVELDDGTLAVVPNKKMVDEVVLNRSRGYNSVEQGETIAQ